MNVATGPGRSVRAILLASLLAIIGLTSMSASASAGPVLWGGVGHNELGQATVLISVQNGRAKLKSVQAIMACTDTSDGSESERAFYVSGGPTDTLNQNRFSYGFTRRSGGRVGRVGLSGRLRSNGNGSARLSLTATGVDSGTGAVIERCQAGVNFRLHRGRTT